MQLTIAILLRGRSEMFAEEGGHGLFSLPCPVNSSRWGLESLSMSITIVVVPVIMKILSLAAPKRI